LSAGGAALIALAEVAGASLAQAQDATELPEVRVSAPSPIRRPSPPRPTTPAPTQITVTPQPQLQGTLPIVTDQFATVTVIPNEELRRTGGGTLGDVLFSKPGITGSGFAPGASSRPIIRGLDVNRVRIQEDGIGANGASDLGEDHVVPVDPLSTNQVEVIRGPATLRYGSQAIGGVVEAINNRVPERLPCAPSTPASTPGFAKAPLSGGGMQPCANVEMRGAMTTVDQGLNGGILLDAGAGNFAVHADAFGRTAQDYSIPAYPYRFEPGRPFNGKQPNSSLRSDGFSVGGSYVHDRGFVGIAVTQNDNLYRIPGIEGDENRTRIDAHQTKILSKGEFRPDSGAVQAIRFWFGNTDYKHREIGASEDDPMLDSVHQTFTNKEQEGRAELQFLPVNLGFAAMTNAIGVQAGHQKLTAPGDAPGPFSGLFSPNDNTRVAGYAFNEFRFSEATRAQIAGRIEKVWLKGTMPTFPADYLPDGNPLVNTQRRPEFTPKSISLGLIQNLPWDLVGSITGQYVERAPKPAELFSRGPHDATATFDIGNPDLKIEAAKSIEVGIRRARGPLRFEATAYYTHFDGFIYRRLTGALCDESFDTCGIPGGELKQAVYSQRNAIFRGAELQSQYEVAPLWTGNWGVEGQFDVVRATFSDGSNVPRIPPVRLGGGLFWRDANWLVRVNLLHAFAHRQVAESETTTPGYNDLKLEISYTTRLARKAFGEPREITIGLFGQNLLNDKIRNSVSFSKDEVLMPGANVRLFANIKF
jgi:iron complex outermembrane receptor protein